MVAEGRQQKETKRAGAQRHQADRNIDRADLPPGGVQLVVNELVVSNESARRLFGDSRALVVITGLCFTARIRCCHAALRDLPPPTAPVSPFP